MREKNGIFRTLDHSPRILFWTLEEFAVMLFPFFLGIWTGSFLVMLSGFALKPLLARYLGRNSSQWKMRLYWYLPKKAFERAGILRRVPPSHIREYLL